MLAEIENVILDARKNGRSIVTTAIENGLSTKDIPTSALLENTHAAIQVLIEQPTSQTDLPKISL